MSKTKPGASTPNAGANLASGKKGAVASQGARKAAGKPDQADVHDARQDSRAQKGAWTRKSVEKHADEIAARKAGGSTYSLD